MGWRQACVCGVGVGTPLSGFPQTQVGYKLSCPCVCTRACVRLEAFPSMCSALGCHLPFERWLQLPFLIWEDTPSYGSHQIRAGQNNWHEVRLWRWWIYLCPRSERTKALQDSKKDVICCCWPYFGGRRVTQAASAANRHGHGGIVCALQRRRSV